MGNDTQKPAGWFETHKDGIKKTAGVVLAAGIGYVLGKKTTCLIGAYNLDRLYKAGALKFFDPEKGVEIGADVAKEVVGKYLRN